jgi:hypothetical protein
MTTGFDKLREHLDPELALDPVNQRVIDNVGGTVGHWQPEKNKVTGLLTVILYGRSAYPQDRLLELAREEVEERRNELTSEGWTVVDNGAVASSPDDWDERFVMFEIITEVESAEEAAAASALLADRHFELEV